MWDYNLTEKKANEIKKELEERKAIAQKQVS
jgi:Na+/melibiose symporter-like transporter